MKNKRIYISALFMFIMTMAVLAFSACSSKNSSSTGGRSTVSMPVPTDTYTEEETYTEEATLKGEGNTRASAATFTTTTTVTTKKAKTTTTKTTTAKKVTTAEVTEAFTEYDSDSYVEYHFRNKKYLNEHFEKHGGEFADDFGYSTAAEYEKGASDVINDPDALYKTEAEDGDGIYYIEATNEFVVLSTDGYIRTYFRPSAGKKYFDRQ